MEDLFTRLRALATVERVSNFYAVNEPLKLHFFLCPKLTNKGMRLNKFGAANAKIVTGLKAEYTTGPAKSTAERLTKLEAFLKEASTQNIRVMAQGIFAAADARLLFALPARQPAYPETESLLLERVALRTKTAITLASNREIFEEHRDLFVQFYEDAPWSSIPARILRSETERLLKMLPEGTPDYLKEDFIRRAFAGFALDGLLLRKGLLGRNPVILGVESPGVPILQNAALPREQWLPVVQLR